MTTTAADRTGTVRLAEIVGALSLATDLGTGHPIERSLRACLLAVAFGAQLGLDERTLSDVYYVALLRWAGCTADSARADIFGDELALGVEIDSVELWNQGEMMDFLQRVIGRGEPPAQRRLKMEEALATGVERAQVAAIANCEIAQNIAARFGIAESAHLALGQLFERWDGGRGSGARQGGGPEPGSACRACRARRRAVPPPRRRRGSRSRAAPPGGGPLRRIAGRALL